MQTFIVLLLNISHNKAFIK